MSGEWAKIYAAVAPEVSGIRRFGSAALDLAWVAAGRMDGFWEDDLDLWDTAAGLLLVKEAGGFVTDYRGSRPIVRAARIYRRSGVIHSQAAEADRRGAAIALASRLRRRNSAVLKRRQVSSPWSFPLASVAAGYLPILLFLIIALGLSAGFVVLPMLVVAA